jgi:hypothetical protein
MKTADILPSKSLPHSWPLYPTVPSLQKEKYVINSSGRNMEKILSK